MIVRLTQATVILLLVVYAMPLVAWLMARVVPGENLYVVGYLNAVGIWWFAPLVVLLPVSFLVRTRQAMVTALALCVPALWLYGADFVPGVPTAVPEDAPTIKVMTFNTLFVNRNYDGVIATIRDANPDVVAAQELAPDMADAITAAFAEEYPYTSINAWPDPRGIGIWSRFPLTAGEDLTLEGWEWWVHEVNLDVEGRPLAIFNVHLWPIGTLDREQFQEALKAQHEQVAELQTMVAAKEVPVIIVGDFNASPTNDSYTNIDKVANDAWREVGWGTGFTYPARGSLSTRIPPFLRIDYLWYRGGVTPLSVNVLPRAGSDHLPLVGEFLLK